MRDRHTLEIHIHNLTRAQALAIEDMLAIWQQGGSLGCSRWTSFFADGDGDFRPACIVNGHVARGQGLLPPGTFWTGKEPWKGEYKMDFDALAAALRVALETSSQNQNAGSERTQDESPR